MNLGPRVLHSDLSSPAVSVFISKVEHFLRLNRVNRGRQQLGGNIYYIHYITKLLYIINILCCSRDSVSSSQWLYQLQRNEQKLATTSSKLQLEIVPRQQIPLITTGPMLAQCLSREGTSAVLLWQLSSSLLLYNCLFRKIIFLSL